MPTTLCTTAITDDTRFLRLPEVMARVGLSRPTIYKAIAAGRFPKYIKVGSASVWNSREIEAWMRAQVEASR
jgi:prophage regulatory protein